MIRRSISALVMGLVLTVGVGQAHAVIFYGTDGFTGDLVRIDSTNGSSSVVGNLGIGGGFGLAVSSTGVAYTRNFSNLYTVDLNTAASTLVGPSGAGITGLSFNGGFTTLYSVSQLNGNFYSIDPATGTATLVGNTGINTPLDLSTNSAGVVYGASQGGSIYTINTATGLATLVAANIVSTGLTAISFDPDDVLYGITLTTDRLVMIDLANNTSTVIGGPIVRQDIRGMDFMRAVPEPSAIALTGMGLLGLLGVARRRRARSVA